MSGAGWGLLDEKEEQELHKQRLLNVEEKPFKRITKRLQTLNAVAAAAARQAPTPPPESGGSIAPSNGDQTHGVQDAATTAPNALSQLKEDITLDFAAFDSSIVRLQFLLTANVRERERYASDRGRILSTSQSVRDSTSALRSKLDEAKATLEQRKKFDELADKITSNRALRPRTEQAANLQKLQEECRQLEAESGEYGRTWRARGEQFDRIMDESMKLRRQIRDEKEEVERREGMDDNDGAAIGEVGDHNTPRLPVSGDNTPRPESGAAGLMLAKGETPARDGETPAAKGGSQMLKPRHETVEGLLSRNGSQAPSREGTPRLSIETRLPEMPKENVDMGGDDEPESSPLTTVPHFLSPVATGDSPPRIVVGDEEGDDKMDTT